LHFTRHRKCTLGQPRGKKIEAACFKIEAAARNIWGAERLAEQGRRYCLPGLRHSLLTGSESSTPLRRRPARMQAYFGPVEIGHTRCTVSVKNFHKIALPPQLVHASVPTSPRVLQAHLNTSVAAKTNWYVTMSCCPSEVLAVLLTYARTDSGDLEQSPRSPFQI
jgi:hypothetical protein